MHEFQYKKWGSGGRVPWRKSGGTPSPASPPHYTPATVSPRNMNQPIEVPFWMWTRVGTRNRTLSGGPDSSRGRAMLGFFRVIQMHYNTEIGNDGKILKLHASHRQKAVVALGQYTSVVRQQVHRNHQFDATTDCPNRCKTNRMTSCLGAGLKIARTGVFEARVV